MSPEDNYKDEIATNSGSNVGNQRLIVQVQILATPLNATEQGCIKMINKEKFAIMKNLKPCPICGNIPAYSTVGSYIDIECCVSMSRQKSDYLTSEERGKWNNSTYCYSQKIEIKVLKIVLEEWNTRAIKGES